MGGRGGGERAAGGERRRVSSRTIHSAVLMSRNGLNFHCLCLVYLHLRVNNCHAVKKKIESIIDVFLALGADTFR